MAKKVFCSVCGNLVDEYDISFVRHNHSSLGICRDCYENGYTWHGEDYVVCKGCTNETDRFCWVEAYSLIQLGEQFICRDYLINNFEKCPKCGEYIFCMNVECTNCGYNRKESY